MDDMVLIPAIIGGIFILLEFIVPGAILVFLGMASLIVAGLLHYDVINGIVEAMLAWFIISLFMVLIVRTIFLRFMPGDYKVTNTDEDLDSIGSIVEVIEEIRPEKKGRIRFRDSTWTAQSDEVIAVGQKAIIKQREGNSWIVATIN